VSSVILLAGLQVLKPLLYFVLGVLGVMVLHLFGTMSILLKAFSRRAPLNFFRAIRPILITAFSTSSSNATLPTTIQVSREALGVSAPTAGFVLPLGATMNMSGTALYEGCVVLFIAQVYGVPLSLAQQATLVVLAVLSAVAVAGIPGGSLPLIVGLLTNFGLPPEGIALILGFDRLLDMARTALNVAADVVTAHRPELVNLAARGERPGTRAEGRPWGRRASLRRNGAPAAGVRGPRRSAGGR
jgi:DAACS family dicarboxylate/amino acid:cation (Na+ or H+) symporter